MKRIVYGFLLLLSVTGYGQGSNFLFIEEVGRQPFYVRMGDESYSSSTGGHLILSGLRDSSYNIFIGFPRSRYPEQLFNIGLRGDRGLELKKNNGEWQLMDLQSSELLRPVRSAINFAGGTKKTDPYSNLMAGVVNDTTVLYSTMVSLSPADTVTVKKTAPAPQKAVADTTSVTAGNNGAVYDKRDIIRYGTENIIEGKLMIYLDRTGPVIDTIRLVIPRQ